MVKKLYKDWNLPMHADLLRSLQMWKREQDQYKSTHKYGNPTLEELGLTSEQVNQRYKKYIEVRTRPTSGQTGRARVRELGSTSDLRAVALCLLV